MSEYKWCPECESTFSIYDMDVECVRLATRDDPPEYISRCPSCGAVDPVLEDAHYCEFCNEYFHAYKFSEVDGMCQACFDTSVKKLKKFVEASGDKADNAVLSFLLDF